MITREQLLQIVSDAGADFIGTNPPRNLEPAYATLAMGDFDSIGMKLRAVNAFYGTPSSVSNGASRNCRDAAHRAIDVAQSMHHDSDPSDTSLAFGVFEYMRTDSEHALNVGVVKRGSAFDLVFWEPQTQKIVNLTATEIASCLNISFPC